MFTNVITLSRNQRRAILRSASETQANIHIEVIPGIALAPRSVGESYHYETRTGLRIYHPSAYAKVGWSSMVYCASTRRVVVGGLWAACAAQSCVAAAA